MSPAELAGRLDDRFGILASRRGTALPRHRTLRAAVEWSYELCDKLERQLWQRLSVFAGDFDLSDAEEVCADGVLTRLDVVEAMRGLVDKSIVCVQVQGGSARFRLLDTLRSYGLDRLRECDSVGDGPDEVEVRARHLAWYADLACQFESEWFGRHQAEWLTRMSAKLPDVRAALGFALERPEHRRSGLKLAGALRWYWGVTAALREGRTWLVRLLDVDPEPSRERARALSALVLLLISAGSPPGGTSLAHEALELTRKEDPERVPRVLGQVGLIAFPNGDPDAVPMLEEALALCREQNLRGEELAYATFSLAAARGLSGQRDASDELFAESIALCREAGDLWWQGFVRVFSAFVAWANGDVEAGAANAVEGLRLCRRVPDLHACAVGLHIAGLLLVGRDDRLAAALLGAADGYWADAGGSMLQAPIWVERVEQTTARCREALGESQFEALYREGHDQPLEEAAAKVLGEPTEAPVARIPTRDQLGLTRREREVAALVAEGLSNRDIAARLVISQRTAETHVQNMLAKTGFSTRSQLAVWFNTQGRG